MNMEICNTFLKSVDNILKEMVDVNACISTDFYPEGNEVCSNGVCSIINFEGKIKGRFMIDMTQDAFLNVIKSIMGRNFECAKDMLILSAIAELNNTIAENAVANLNNKYSFELKLASPTVLVAKEALVCIDKIPSYSAICKTTYGDIKVNVAFNEEALTNV